MCFFALDDYVAIFMFNSLLIQWNLQIKPINCGGVPKLIAQLECSYKNSYSNIIKKCIVKTLD